MIIYIAYFVFIHTFNFYNTILEITEDFLFLAHVSLEVYLEKKYFILQNTIQNKNFCNKL